MSDREPADEEQDEQDGAEEKEQPDQEQVLKEREERLDPENRPDNVEVDNTDRTFDPETGFFEDRDEHDSAPKQFVDEEAISAGRLTRARPRRSEDDRATPGPGRRGAVPGLKRVARRWSAGWRLEEWPGDPAPGARAHRRAGRRCRACRGGGRGVGCPGRSRRGARGRGGVPARQDLRRRTDPAGDRRAAAARAGRLGARAHDEPRAPGARVRADAPPALARRQPARLRLGGAAHGARRPPAHDGDEVRGGGRGRCPRGRRTTRRRPGDGGGLPEGRRAVRDRLRAAGGRRRRPLAAGQGAGPRVAPGDGVRRRRAGVRALGALRRRVDQLAPRAARRGRRDPLRLRLDLPARRRRGEHRRRHPGDGEAAGGGRAEAADAALRRPAPRGVRARRAAAGADLRAAADGWRGVPRGRPQLGADRRRRRVRQPAQRRGHRLRPRDRAPGRRGAGRARRRLRGVAGAAA